jgi:glycogen operon protein
MTDLTTKNIPGAAPSAQSLNKPKKVNMESSQLTEIFHTNRDEEAAKPDGSRYVMKSDDLGASIHCQSTTLSSSQHPSGSPIVVGDEHEISGLVSRAAFGKETGRSFPLGATVLKHGVNFSIFSKHAKQAELLLFDHIEDTKPSKVIPLTTQQNRSYHYWHVFVPGLKEGQIYAWRMYGPFNSKEGLRFDSEKVLLDPYGKCIALPSSRSRKAAAAPGDNCVTAIKNVVVHSKSYDWEGDLPLHHPLCKTVIYEMNIGTFTSNPNSGLSPEKRGTYAGVIEKIPYLKELGITAVELLPIFAFDSEDAPDGLSNIWGYQPYAFFAPHPQYSSKKEPLAVLDEFRSMVKALHRANIEVILDVVFNHTTEGGLHGPTLSFRGLGNETYYILGKDKATYADFSGCGNTFNANESIVRRLILDSLRYWVDEMHIDGFRFDLASILSRDESGTPMAHPPTIWDIESDPVLANIKLFAEAWDAAGLYQVGHFPGDSWNEWNGHFRDDVRSFIKGDNNTIRSLAYRMTGSPDIYENEERNPEQSVNFITCHDGFTLNDLVSYNEKHNEANQENNRDGSNFNCSWNCGMEGPTEDSEIEKLRNRQIKNFLTILFFSVGTPMILAGDEVRRTQQGNNNAYCHAGDIGSFDWSLLKKHADIHRFTRQLINFRLDRSHLCDTYAQTLRELLIEKAIEWHGVKLNAPDLGADSHALAATMRNYDHKVMIHIMINSFWKSLEFEIPLCTNFYTPWRCCIDTFKESPQDILPWKEAPSINAESYLVESRSVVILVSKMEN